MTVENRTLGAALVGVAFAFAASGAFAQMPSGTEPMGDMHSGHEMAGSSGGMMAAPQAANTSGMPTMPGQEAFGTIQEIVGILEADPSTDWSKVDIAGLREHLVDMNALVMDAQVNATEIPGGLRIKVTGTGGTLRAIHAMVPAHAPMIDGLNGWRVTAENLPDGAVLTATATNAGEAAHIRGLGFFGLMVTGSHHQVHHLNLARGEPMQAM